MSAPTDESVSLSHAVDDTARLVLLDKPDLGVVAFHRAVRAEHDRSTPYTVLHAAIVAAWRRYRGDKPTHDVATGRRLTTP
ncbi:hypothetical protein [Saccharothrix hoggarensis]|uniref:Uncharacterized protein n=1 Tax=Saccharothrix hoggarensis TaxID=913853 RepID=A0ABW3R694_9PSEU